MIESDLAKPNSICQVPVTKANPPPVIVCNIYSRCAHYQEGLGSKGRSEDIGKGGGTADDDNSKPLTNRQIKLRNDKAKAQRNRRAQANLAISGEGHLPVHISNPNPMAKIRFFDKSFICWADASRKTIIAVVKFHPFSTMDPIRKEQYQFLSHHLIAQTAFQNPNKTNGPQYAGDMYSLGWRKAYEADTQIGIQGIAKKISRDQIGYEELQTHVPKVNEFIGERFRSVSVPLFEEVKKQHNLLQAPGLAPHFKDDPDGFTCHLSFTIGNFANLPHEDTDASPFSFVMWIPIKEDTGDIIESNFQVRGGEFVFPDNACGINFAGFDGIVECAWKATAYSHLTLPSQSPPNSFHTRMGLSCQLPKKTQVALEKIKNKFYVNHPTQSHYTIRDIKKVLDDSNAYI